MIEAAVEQLRQPRKVRIGVIQNAIVLPTTDLVVNQQKAIHSRIEEIISAASLCGVNIICLQEAWSKYDITVKVFLINYFPSYAIRILYERKTSMD